MDNHTEYESVRFADDDDQFRRNDLDREINRLQQDLNNDPEFKTIQSVYFWTNKKKDRLEMEIASLRKMDQENYTTGTLLEDSEQNVAEGYKENNELKKQLTDIFKDNLEVRKRCVFCFV